MTHDDWLATRRKGIGASDIAAALNLSSFTDACPLGLYMDKVGLLPDRDSRAKRSGRMLEDVVATMYEEETGHKVRTLPLQSIRHPVHRWVMSTPDRDIEDLPWWLECKTARNKVGWGAEGTDQVPEVYLLQGHWQLLTGEHLGIEAIELAVLFYGQELRCYQIRRNHALQERLLELASDFWDKVLRREPPDPDWQHPATPELIKLLCRPRVEMQVELDAFLALEVDAWQDCGKQIGLLEKQRKLHRARIDYAMGEANMGLLPDGTTITRKTIDHPASPRSGYSETRMFIKKPRAGAEGEDS